MFSFAFKKSFGAIKISPKQKDPSSGLAIYFLDAKRYFTKNDQDWPGFFFENFWILIVLKSLVFEA